MNDEPAVLFDVKDTTFIVPERARLFSIHKM